MCMFRDLRADEIDVRVAQATEYGVTLLLYKDARVDMDILDETVGQANWQNKFYEHKSILFCSLGINVNYKDPSKEPCWIWKDDAGTESNTEAEKGNASDARKRAGFAWAIGRELYTSPVVKIRESACNIKQYSGKWKCYDTFKVEAIRIENKRIVGLAIRNATTGKRCFEWVDEKWKAEQEKKNA